MAEPPSFLKDSLLGPFSTALPTGEETRLLQACLWSGEPGVLAWRKWSHEIADPAAFLRQEKDGIKGLLPLLFDSLQANDASVEGEFRTYLRTAYLRDELRSRSFGRICRGVIDALADARVPAVLLKGAALAETCYKSPGLQHAHYLEILIRDDDLSRAVEALRPHAFTCASIAGWEREGVELVHESGLPLVLHRRLFRLPFYSVNMEEIWARSRNEMLYGGPTRVLCSSDNLFHICGSVFDLEQHESLRWVCDAWFLIQRSPNLDWNLLLEYVRESRMALPLFVTAGYLVESLDAPIPTSFLTRLQTAALKAERVEREAALFAVQTHARGGLKKIIRDCRDWRTRGFVLKWAFLPSLDYMRGVYKVPSAFLLPLTYPYRPLKFTLRSMWFWGRRVARRLREKFDLLRTGRKAISS
jgi:Uncharacterised nucleotidyltransferase